jgi:hypothetical protein
MVGGGEGVFGGGLGVLALEGGEGVLEGVGIVGNC